jgi:hypothetical protein
LCKIPFALQFALFSKNRQHSFVTNKSSHNGHSPYIHAALLNKKWETAQINHAAITGSDTSTKFEYFTNLQAALLKSFSQWKT